MNQSPEIKELFAALTKAQVAIKGASKDSKNPHFKNVYASLESTWDAVKDALADNGLCITQLVHEANSHYYLMTTLGHISGQWISSSIPLLMQKHDMQGLGSAITYARRYGLQAILSCPSIDDDGEGSVAPRTAPVAPVAPLKVAKPATVFGSWKFAAGKYAGKHPKDLTDDELVKYFGELKVFVQDNPGKAKDPQLVEVLSYLVIEMESRKL